MLETSARLLRLLTLLQTRSFWSGVELAARLEVTERTVRRDVDKLRSLGYPVNSSTGVAGGYQLGSGASLPPLLLEDDEALAVALGLRSAAAGTVSGMEEAAVRALAKLEQVLPARLRRRFKALHSAVAPLYTAGPTVRPEVLMELARACRAEERVSFEYADGKGNCTRRNTEPLGLVHAGSRWYLVAWDSDRADFRTFRIDRVGAAPLQFGARFVPRKIPGGDLSAYVSRSVATSPYSYTAHVVLHAPLEQMSQRISPLTGRLERIDERSCRLAIGGNSLPSLALYIAMYGVEFEVLEPKELVDEVATLAGRLARATRVACRALTK